MSSGGSRPAVTAGIAFHNDSAFIELAIRSVFAQTLRDWELILIDDGSSDGSLDVVRGIADPRLRVFSDGANRGLAARLNEMARLARAPLLARMDADDVMTPDRLERQVKVLADATVDLVAAAAWTIDVENRPYGVRGGLPGPVGGRDFLRRTAYVHPTVMGRREWFLQNPYDESFRRAQDRELWCRTHAYTNTRVLAQPALFYRESGASSKANYAESCKADRRVVRRYGPALAGRWSTWQMLAISGLKQLFQAVAMNTPVGRIVVKRRSRILTPDQLTEASAQMAAVVNTVLAETGRLPADQVQPGQIG